MIEDAGSGIGLIQFLERKGIPVGKAVPVKSKPIRAMSVPAPIQRLALCSLLNGPWNERFITGLMAKLSRLAARSQCGCVRSWNASTHRDKHGPLRRNTERAAV